MLKTNEFRLAKEFVFSLVVIMLALVIGFYVPMLGLLVAGVIAAPVVLFTLRYGEWVGGGLLLAVTSLLILLFKNELVGIGFLCEFGFMSQALAFSFRKGFSKEKSILIGFVVTLLAVLLLIGGASGLFEGGSFSNFIAKQIEYSISQTVQVYESMEIEAEQKEMLLQTLEVGKDFLLKAYPGVYASMTLLIVIANCFASKFLLLRLGYGVTDATPFKSFLLPESLVWGFIIAASLMLAGMQFALPAAKVVGMNLILPFVTLYLVQGLAIIVFWGPRIRLPAVLKWFGLFLIFIQPILLLLVIGVGLFDVWFDFRKLKQQTGG